jgi:hypothetical protein
VEWADKLLGANGNGLEMHDRTISHNSKLFRLRHVNESWVLEAFIVETPQIWSDLVIKLRVLGGG